MPDKPNNPLSFWQELKRRKVLRIITIYAAVSFVILQLVEILAPSLRLPDWTMNFILVVLIVGFIIAIILSWIYDIHPEEGIVKTEPAHKVKDEDQHPSSKGWKIASYISFVVIFGLIVLNIIPRSSKKETLDTSIAVLPLVNLSSNDDISSIGFTNEIIMELQKIKAFSRVLSLTSTMQFAEHQPTIPEIGQILKVNYIIEGTIQKQHEKISIIIQVISAKEDDHIWAEEFEDEWGNRFTLQDQIALVVAKELQAIITPEEKQLMEKIPTTNLTAYDFYQRGREEHEKYWLNNDIKDFLERAEDLYYQALEYDSAFGLAYTGLAQVYRDKRFQETLLTENFLDSSLILANRALSFDDQLSEAFLIRGYYYEARNQDKQAINEYDKAIKLNPNEWRAYNQKGFLYYHDDYIKCIDNYQKAATLHRGSFLPGIYRRLGMGYAHAGFKEKAIYYAKEALKLDDDSASYYFRRTIIEDTFGNFEKAIEYGEKSNAIDSSYSLNYLGLDHMYLDQFEESLKYYNKLIDQFDAITSIPAWQAIRIGYVYWVNGFKEEADYLINLGLEKFNTRLKLGRFIGLQEFHIYYGLAAIQAFLGDKDKAYEYLRLFNQWPRMPIWVIKEIKNCPLLDSIRDEPEFQQIVRDVQAKYQAEHERVRKWLEENDML